MKEFWTIFKKPEQPWVFKTCIYTHLLQITLFNIIYDAEFQMNRMFSCDYLQH